MTQRDSGFSQRPPNRRGRFVLLAQILMLVGKVLVAPRMSLAAMSLAACQSRTGSWLKPKVASRAARFQRRAYIALVTMMMSYFETNDKGVLSVFCASIGLVVFFWFLTKSVATAAPEWIAGRYHDWPTPPVISTSHSPHKAFTSDSP